VLTLVVVEVVVGLVLVVGSLWVTRRSRRLRAKPGATGSLDGFVETDEIFIDPTTGARQRVWFDPRTGERRYVTLETEGTRR
jgi:hypothetical protein